LFSFELEAMCRRRTNYVLLPPKTCPAYTPSHIDDAESRICSCLLFIEAVLMLQQLGWLSFFYPCMYRCRYIRRELTWTGTRSISSGRVHSDPILCLEDD
jgi:hypothetical protein